MRFLFALITCLIAACSLALAAGLRVATFNVGARLVVPPDGGPAYFDYGIGPAGQPNHDAVKDVLRRINADVVALQEIHSADVQSGSLTAMANSLGYTHRYVAPTTQAFDTTLRVAVLSKYPFLNTNSIGSPTGAREMTRRIPAVTIDVPDTEENLLFISPHLKSGTSTADRFRRTIEMRRLTGYLTQQAISNSSPFVVLGDFNPSGSNTTFSALPSGLPSTFSLGADITFPLSYSRQMLAYFTNPLPIRVPATHTNGSSSTFDTTNTNGPILDLILVSSAIFARGVDSEVYNSTFDTSNSIGLPKSGSPLATTTSAVASDHYAVFADLLLDSPFEPLTASLSAPSVQEGSAAGTVSWTINLPAPQANDVTLTVSSDNSQAASFTTSSWVIPAGSLQTTIPLTTPRNFITDGTRSVVLTASASGFTSVTSALQVLDADPPYAFTAAGQVLGETFTQFNGSQAPAPWSTPQGGAWRGLDNGSASTFGFRSYGVGLDGSLGFFPKNTTGIATTAVFNNSPEILTALQIDFTAEQWRAAAGGKSDSLRVELITETETIPITALEFIGKTNLTTGALSPPVQEQRSAIITGLSIEPAASFDLRFSFQLGGQIPDSVWINELHYDNAGTDQNEFIELIMAPGYDGTPADFNVVLYNGDTASSAVVYQTLNVGSQFILTDLPSGYRLLRISLPTNGLQNGPRDGLALVHVPSGEVRQLLSYNGIFTAGSGPAAGMTSIAIPVSQSNTSTPIGSSIGLTGSGSQANQFTWAVFNGAATNGSLNNGQTLSPVSLSQGISFDNLQLTFLLDTDQDGLPDLTDSDDDGDLLADSDEILFGSNPLDASSIYQPTWTRDGPASINYTFPTILNRSYRIERSIDLNSWSNFQTYAGTGVSITASLPITVNDARQFYRLAVSAD